MSSLVAADVVVPAVIVARFLVPLAIPRYPLPGVLASMAVDAADQDVFEALIGGELAGYQPYDKALDVYSLSVTMLAILRNWQSRAAVASGVRRALRRRRPLIEARLPGRRQPVDALAGPEGRVEVRHG